MGGKTKTNQTKRFWCEEDSQTLKEIKAAKNNGKTITRNGVLHEYVGDDMLLNTKTNRLEKL